MTNNEKPKLEQSEVAKDTRVAEKNKSTLFQQEKAKAALEWITNQEDRKLLILHFGLKGRAAHPRGALAALNRSTVSEVTARLDELLDPNLYIYESNCIKQRERAWRAYPYMSLGESEFLRELFVFYGPQMELDPRQFALAKISWESLKQKIEQNANKQIAPEELGRCSLKEHNFLFQKMINPQLSMSIRETVAQLWQRMDLQERRIAVLGFGLAGYRKHDPQEIARMLMHGQPSGIEKARGLLRRIENESAQHIREMKKWL